MSDAIQQAITAMEWMLCDYEHLNTMGQPLSANWPQRVQAVKDAIAGLQAAQAQAGNVTLERYGLQWNGPDKFVATLMADGYWTPWHIAQHALKAQAGDWKWIDPAITHYRPIFTEQAEPVKEPDYDPRSVSFNLFEQLAAAHEAAAKIPDIIAQFKVGLEKYGHTVVPMTPFVGAESQCCGNPAQCWEPCVDLGKDERYVGVVEPEAAVGTSQDFSAVVAADGLDDWRNWKPGDRLICVDDEGTLRLKDGELYTLYEISAAGFVSVDPRKDVPDLKQERFHFHSRPAGRNNLLAKNQDCGCVICTCENDERCMGCGAKHCGTHPVGQIPRPKYIQ